MSLISSAANAGVYAQSSPKQGHPVANTSPIGDDAFIGIAAGGFCFIICTLGVLRWQGLCCFGRRKRRASELAARASADPLDNSSALNSMAAPIALFSGPSSFSGDGAAAPSSVPTPPTVQPNPHPTVPTLAAAAATLLNLGPAAYVSSIVFARGRHAPV